MRLNAGCPPTAPTHSSLLSSSPPAMSSSETSERAALLVEIASLEAQISVLSSKQQPNANRPTKRARLSPSFGDEESIAEKL